MKFSFPGRSGLLFCFPQHFFLLFALLCFCTLQGVKGQEVEAKSQPFLRINYQLGGIVQNNGFVKGDNELSQPIKSFHAFSVEIGSNRVGAKRWEQVYQYPCYGIGYYRAYYPDTDELGNPSALYAFFGAPIKRWKRFWIGYEMSGGFSWGWKPFDPDENPYQVLIGSTRSIYIDMGLKLGYLISPLWEVELVNSFTHFSAGGTTAPNVGLNQFGPKFSLRYNFRPRPAYFEAPLPAFESRWEYYNSLTYGSGFKELKFDNEILDSLGIDPAEARYLGASYSVLTLSLALQRQISYRFKLGGGLDIMYNGLQNPDFKYADGAIEIEKGMPRDKLSLSIFASVELVTGRTSMVLQPAFVLAMNGNSAYNPPRFSQRIGLKHHLCSDQRLFLMAALRVRDFTTAQYIEAGLGYRIPW